MRSNRFEITTVFAAVVAVAASLGSFDAPAQTYPTKPIRIVVALSAGSQNDILAHIIAPTMSENWRQPPWH